jgi:hypothetical protein
MFTTVSGAWLQAFVICLSKQKDTLAQYENLEVGWKSNGEVIGLVFTDQHSGKTLQAIIPEPSP